MLHDPNVGAMAVQTARRGGRGPARFVCLSSTRGSRVAPVLYVTPAAIATHSRLRESVRLRPCPVGRADDRLWSLFDRVIHVSGDSACDDHALIRAVPGRRHPPAAHGP